ncbi:hypothetical protein B0T19DRAFT_403527 [Cercophora scortea]|uniref:F-box domain-containing protein n=1 Tax=Cercophora scortea TaxID=314031 RepID=A0AAE0I9Q5_9PEZI|nr:hypothetical protein B0T19DRAFT_403527 [Cercophora scortea]
MAPPPLLVDPEVEYRVILPEDRSQQAYPIDETQDVDAICRVTAYHRDDFDLVVVSRSQHRTDFLRMGLMGLILPVFWAADLGTLEKLPVEILMDIIRRLDFASVVRFLRVNRRARQVVAELPEYSFVVTHGLDTVLGLFEVRLASRFSLAQLDAVIRIGNCLRCGQFAGYVFLPTLERCCLRCLDTAMDFEVLVLTDAKAEKLWNSDRNGSLPFLRTKPGYYTFHDKYAHERGWLVPAKAVSPFIKFDRLTRFFRYMAATAQPHVTGRGHDVLVQRGIYCKSCLASVEKRVHAAGNSPDIPPLSCRVFSQEEYIKHFQWCRGAQAMWEASAGGTLPVEEPKLTRQRGAFRYRDFD